MKKSLPSAKDEKEMTRIWKLTDQHMQTHQGHRWRVGEPFETDGKGELCGPGFIHAYTHPALALLLNPIHANITAPRLWPARGIIAKTDHGLKVGCTHLVILPEEVIPTPKIPLECSITFAIFCALKVYHEPTFQRWAEDWLSNANRANAAATRAAWAAAGAATRAAGAAGPVEEAARGAAIEAARAAARAAWAAEGTAWAAGAAAWAAEGAVGAAVLDLIALAKAATLPMEWPT